MTVPVIVRTSLPSILEECGPYKLAHDKYGKCKWLGGNGDFLLFNSKVKDNQLVKMNTTFWFQTHISVPDHEIKRLPIQCKQEPFNIQFSQSSSSFPIDTVVNLFLTDLV